MELSSVQHSESLNSSSSSEDLDDICIDHELVDLDAVVQQKKPHFLDLDAIPPPGFDDDTANNIDIIQFTTTTDDGAVKSKKITKSISTISSTSNSQQQNHPLTDCPGETVKVDKKFERDGEISDYELAASGYTKKEFTTIILPDDQIHNKHHQKKKHFLDENPIPPDYMLADKESREHRSLDRNFERQIEQQTQIEVNTIQQQRYERKHSLDREGRSRKTKEPSYTLSRFIESDLLLETSNQSRGTWPTVIDRQSEIQRNYSSMPTGNIQNLGPKVECVYSLLSMLGSNDSVEMSKKFLELSRTTETCATLRRSGCISLLVQMMHSESDDNVRKRAAMALHNVVHCHPDDKAGRREAKVLRLIEQIMDYYSFLKTLLQSGGETIADDSDRHPLAAISSLMKVSFDEEHRHAMCQLGALQAIASLVHLDHAAHGPKPEDQCCNSLRRYALMALTNLTFGDGNNKALLCSNKEFMEALVAQLDSAPDDLLQVTASVLRNLSWRADNNMKTVLNEIGTVTALAKAAMKNKNENTLKAILSALWNLSAHCSTNKAEFCAVDGTLAFLVDMLSYEGPSKTLKIIENAGGILRNVSSHIAVREDYRKILRQRNCLGILLQQLKSESLTVVSNACGTLWNLSARFPEDQKYLWDNGAVPMLRSLIHSKHKMISEGSSAALKNLLNFRPGIFNPNNLDPIAKSMGLKELPTLNVRKQKALESELNPNLSETCDNLDVITPPKEKKVFLNDTTTNMTTVIGGKHTTTRLTRSAVVSKSESRDSIISAKSDSVYEKLRRGNSAPPQTNNNMNDYLTMSTTKSTKSMNAFNVRENNYTRTGNERGFDVQETELPIDYSAKYNENDQQQQKITKVESNNVQENNMQKTNERSYPSAYQETDLDQPTDFSLRYAENQAESDSEVSEEKQIVINNQIIQNKKRNTDNSDGAGGNEIILILEDTVKCYQTEDTPYVISNAASVSDLRNPKQEEVVVAVVPKPKRSVPQQQQQHHHAKESAGNYALGSYTPEKPINYCEEGTPGYFSRYESLSSLDESPLQNSIIPSTNLGKMKPQTVTEESGLEQQMDKLNITNTQQQEADSSNLTKELKLKIEPMPHSSQPEIVDAAIATVTTVAINKLPNNSAQETPLMFSRRSSMDSLAEEEVEPMTADDKSSIVSDFSRLASGVISPSELPDSPTQSMPQSPRRNINTINFPNSDQTQQFHSTDTNQQIQITGQSEQRLRSVFEDDLNRFQVENTPAQFSCATSLSNLSLYDEAKIATDSLDKEMLLMVNSPKDKTSPIQLNNETENPNNIVATNKRESCGFSEGEEDGNNDDYILATCINNGMNRNMTGSKTKINTIKNNSAAPADDTLLKYCTEDTPALLSKVGSNSNLSILSIASNNKCDEHAINLSDLSSNASDCGSDLLEQCIRDGMLKTTNNNNKRNNLIQSNNNIEDPIAMLRRGGSGTGLPPYLPVKDEMNKFLVEDSPCNFSVISGLSNLTVGSGVAGPANIKRTTEKERDVINFPIDNKNKTGDDSLSSISIESEDDSNLLSQAIAAGCNRPKSNLGHNIPKTQPQAIPIRELSNRQQQHQIEPNDSLSSVDSSDSNDNQAKSLFEQCIRTGMNKQSSAAASTSSNRKSERRIQSNVPQLNTVILSPKRSQLPTLAIQNQKTPLQMDRERQRERERKDEQLLKECITTGMIKTTAATSINRIGAGVGGSSSNFVINELSNNSAQIKHPIRHQQQRLVTGSSQASTDVGGILTATTVQQQHQHQQFLIAQQQHYSKNGETTSAVVLEQHRHREQVTILQSAPNTAPDVGMRESPDGTSTELRSPQTISTTQSSTRLTTASPTPPDSLKITMEQQQIQYDPHQQIETINHLQQDLQNSQLQKNNNDTITGFKFKENLQNSINLSNDLNILEVSNEYPALKLSNIDYMEDDSLVNESSFEMEISNEFLIENDTTDGFLTNDEKRENFETIKRKILKSKSNKIVQDKHKDPDLMLKSVERLTHELVSTAEYLRTNSGIITAQGTVILTGSTISNCPDLDSSSDKKSDQSVSNSNNTWNEDTCPNDVSFPSVSVTAPIMNASLNDDETTTVSDFNPQIGNFTHCPINDFTEITPTNEMQPLEMPNSLIIGISDLPGNSQPNSLETETDTLIEMDKSSKGSSVESTTSNSGILFKVGGAVKQPHLNKQCINQFSSLEQQPLSLDPSTMSNSTIIAIEANKLADNFIRNMTESTNSLDLDQIRPPSCMDTISMSGCFDSINGGGISGFGIAPQSPQLSRIRKKSLPAGLMARRALGCTSSHIPSGNGSLESINSSYNLDMIKPPSLMDELLDSMISVASITSEIVDHSLGNTNYDTAFSDGDDMTATLQSCNDGTFPIDGDGLAGDDSSQDTPIPSDFSSAESTPRKGGRSNINNLNCITTNSASSHNYLTAASISQIGGGVKRMLTPKQKRRLIKDRYKTYTVAADFVLKESFSSENQSEDDIGNGDGATGFDSYRRAQSLNDDDDFDEVLKIEIEENLTPLQRRQENPSRFETQIIDSDRSSERSNNHSPSSVKRRTINPERFKTRTIILPGQDVTNNLMVTKTGELESLTSTEDDSEEMSSIRALTKQFKFITQPETTSTGITAIKQRTSIPMINQFIRMKLLEDDNQMRTTFTPATTATESDYNSMECDQNSETESCDQNATRGTTDDEITTSPNKKSIPIKAPRIIKPNFSNGGTDKDSGTDLNFSEDPMTPPENTNEPVLSTAAIKTVRGRKKPAYVSPYKKSIVSGNSTRTTSPKSQNGTTTIRANLATKNPTKQILMKNNSTGVVVAKTHVLLNKGNLTNKINALKTGLARPGFGIGGAGVTNKRNFVAEKNLLNNKLNSNLTKKSSGTNSQCLDRQGTFVKDEPLNIQVPVVGSVPTSPIKLSKLPTKSSPHTSQININSTIKPSAIPKSPAKTMNVVNTGTYRVQKSSSMGTNSKLKNTIPATTKSSLPIATVSPIVNEKQRKSFIGVRKSPSTPTVPQRSNSNASLRQAPCMTGALRTDLPSTNPPSRSNSNLTTSGKISQIGSRIAGIWKRVEENKKLTNNKCNGKPPIGTSQQQQQQQQQQIQSNNSKPLIRSTTFDNSPQGGNNNEVKKKITNTDRQRFRN